MATYAIGDIQGCFLTLERLLRRIQYDRKQDRLWLAGDLVNRGPRSLEVLRWAAEQGDRVTAVLGNHDLHLIMTHAGVQEPRKNDTFDAVLAARDAGDLVAWLRARPLVHVEPPYLLVHGGLWPTWTAELAALLSQEASAMLAAEPDRLLRALAGWKARAWHDELGEVERCRTVLHLMTTLRCIADGEPVKFSGPPDEAPAGAQPWYDVPPRAWADHTLLYGHWAAGGYRRAAGRIALDSGCVWGKALTAVRLDDGKAFHEPAADGTFSD